MDEPGILDSLITIEATAVVTHPEGTTFDENGLPIPPAE
jgi:hypothetical protein